MHPNKQADGLAQLRNFQEFLAGFQRIKDKVKQLRHVLVPASPERGIARDELVEFVRKFQGGPLRCVEIQKELA